MTIISSTVSTTYICEPSCAYSYMYFLNIYTAALIFLFFVFNFFFSFLYFYSEDAMDYSKEFVTSVVLGKDLVPRYAFYYCISSTQCIIVHYHNKHICLSPLIGLAFHN